MHCRYAVTEITEARRYNRLGDGRERIIARCADQAGAGGVAAWQRIAGRTLRAPPRDRARRHGPRRRGATTVSSDASSRSRRSSTTIRRAAASSARSRSPRGSSIHRSCPSTTPGVADDGTPFYVMRRVSGAPLDRADPRATTLDGDSTLLPHVLAVADAIAHAHRAASSIAISSRRTCSSASSARRS